MPGVRGSKVNTNEEYNEAGAKRRSNTLCNQLEAFSGVTYQVTIDAKDAAEATPKEVRKLRKLIT